MPTGYTAEIKDMSFDDYVWGCARAMGALVLMRDEPSGTKIPERFEPSTYHIKAINEAETRLVALQNMTIGEVESAAKDEAEQESKRVEESIQDAKSLQSKYEEMLARVNAWEPPTEDHTHFKDFMADQLVKSISFDCSTDYWDNKTLVQLTGAEWLHEAIGKALKDIVHHKKEDAKEIERTENRNDWLFELRMSLK